MQGGAAVDPCKQGKARDKGDDDAEGESGIFKDTLAVARIRPEDDGVAPGQRKPLLH